MGETGPVGGSTELRRFADDGRIPNNPSLPLVIYRLALPKSQHFAKDFETKFAANGWHNSWRNGVFDYHHYHSNTHEVLGVATGEARVCFGGEQGEVLALAAGDVAILPAGTGHNRVGERRFPCRRRLSRRARLRHLPWRPGRA